MRNELYMVLNKDGKIVDRARNPKVLHHKGDCLYKRIKQLV